MVPYQNYLSKLGEIFVNPPFEKQYPENSMGEFQIRLRGPP